MTDPDIWPEDNTPRQFSPFTTPGLSQFPDAPGRDGTDEQAPLPGLRRVPRMPVSALIEAVEAEGFGGRSMVAAAFGDVQVAGVLDDGADGGQVGGHLPPGQGLDLGVQQRLVSNPDGTVSLQAQVNQQYVTTNDANAPLIANQPTNHGWEQLVVTTV